MYIHTYVVGIMYVCMYCSTYMHVHTIRVLGRAFLISETGMVVKSICGFNCSR